MSKNNESETVETLEQTLSRVMGQAQKMAATDEKHIKITLLVKIAVLVFILLYMPWAYSNLRIVNADFIVFTATEKINDSLPQAKKEMAAHLKEVAPEVLSQISDEVLKGIPNLAKQFETYSKEIFTRNSSEAEELVTDLLVTYIQETKAVADEMFPDQNSYDKITSIRGLVIEDVKRAIKGVSVEIGESLRSHPFISRLRHLASGKNLTEKEKLQRDIIALWYVLIQQQLDEETLEGFDMFIHKTK